MPSFLKNVAIFGASGNVGVRAVRELIAQKRFTITAITRPGSSATFASEVKTVSNDLSSVETLVPILQGQDLVLISLSYMSAPEVQTRIIDAAAQAGVPWILPNEFGSDTALASLNEQIPLMAVKAQYREQIEARGLGWIGIITNPWTDRNLELGLFGIDIAKRSATLLTDTVKFDTTTLDTLARAIAKIAALPVDSTTPEQASLTGYKNQFVYINSFSLTQQELFESVQKSAGAEGWEISTKPVKTWMQEGKDRIAAGDFAGFINVLFGLMMGPGEGGNYSATRPLANKVLDLPPENLDEVVRQAVEKVQQGATSAI